jgi:hypothetical protein
MIDYKFAFYANVPFFLFAFIYFLFGWDGLFECIVDVFILGIIFVLIDFLAWKIYE